MSTIRPLNKELQQKAEVELNEDPGRVREDITHIKEWLGKQKHLHARTDDQWILSFLRGCKFSLERTKEKLDMYHTMKTLLPEFYENRDPMLPEIQEILKQGILLPLPKTTDPAAPRVLLTRAGVYDEKISPSTIFKTNLLVQDILVMEDDNYIVAGHYVFQDMENLTMSHFTQMSPGLMKKAMTCFEKAYPTRPKGMYFVNIPSFFELINNMVKPFLSDKIKSRMTAYGGDYDDVFKTIPKSILPKEYGGEAGTLEELTAEWKKKVESYREWLLDDEQYKSIESNRPGKPKNTDDMFGIEGSFRKLNVD